MSIDKLLAGVAREIAHHHFNAAQLRAGAGVVGRVQHAAARAGGVARARIDILRETIEPAALRDHDVHQALGTLRAALAHRLRERDIGPDHVVAAHATLELPGAPAAPDAPYHCRIDIIDARGKTHSASIPD